MEAEETLNGEISSLRRFQRGEVGDGTLRRTHFMSLNVKVLIFGSLTAERRRQHCQCVIFTSYCHIIQQPRVLRITVT